MSSEAEQKKRPSSPPPSPSKLRPIDIVEDVIKQTAEDLRFSGGGDSGSGSGNYPPKDKPDSPGGPDKKLDWTTNIEEISPDRPQVTVEMDADEWARFQKINPHPITIEAKPIILVEVGGVVFEIEVIIRSNQSWTEFKFIIKPSFNKQGTFIREFLQLCNSQLEKLGTGFFMQNKLCEQKIQIIWNAKQSTQDCVQVFNEAKKGLAVILEIALKMFKNKEKKTLIIPTPFVREETGTQPSLLGMKAREKVKGLEVTDIHLSLADMGGNDALKEQIQRLVIQYQNPDFFEDRGVSLPKGVLLYGPPGTGKTLAAKIFAGEIQRKFYYVKASDILSKYYGESEQAVKDIFQHVEGPCIIFIDEIDSIGEHRDFASEPTRRVLSELLQQLDGMTSRSDIILLAATNRKDSLDPALLRPGRFDRHIYVDNPDEEGRKQIWKIHIKKQQENSKVEIFDKELDINQLAKETDGMVGADIEEIVRRTKEKAVFKSFEETQDVLISSEMLVEEIQSYREERSKRASQKPDKTGYL